MVARYRCVVIINALSQECVLSLSLPVPLAFRQRNQATAPMLRDVPAGAGRNTFLADVRRRGPAGQLCRFPTFSTRRGPYGGLPWAKSFRRGRAVSPALSQTSASGDRFVDAFLHRVRGDIL